jgi:DNA-directed RNA polymerase subunit L
MTRYSIKTESLEPWVKFIWHFEAKAAEIHHKLLPIDCIDLILNLSGDISYETDSNCVLATPFHINGLRSKHSYVHQTGNIHIFGISFYPFGLYPFIHKSLVGVKDEVVDLFEFALPLARKLELAVMSSQTTDHIVEEIEKALYMELNVKEEDRYWTNLIRDYLVTDGSISMQSFCLEHSINIKTFKRKVLCYSGYTPKVLLAIKRFQKAGNQLAHQNQNSCQR